ncbi:uncharacterized protein LOC129751220 [Uranotaenia lowii]|uniref:uncharacterized protein LOC129751220 n=1 Tax=Uranotaenia lowii TaxID=190385 RepID=UPI0024796A30|nr:uncharacterized protein LOC129751220 [Uranotaenia lowii]
MSSLTMMFRSSSCLLVLAFAVSVGAYWSANSGFDTDEQSYFFGGRNLTDTLCFQKTVTKGTQTPVKVSYQTSSTTKNITMVTANADRDSTYGYSMYLETGAIGTNTVTFKIMGKALMPYNILIEFWCTP